jgi:hypothetical protein
LASRTLANIEYSKEKLQGELKAWYLASGYSSRSSPEGFGWVSSAQENKTRPKKVKMSFLNIAQKYELLLNLKYLYMECFSEI